MATKVPANSNVFIDEVWAKQIQEERKDKLIALQLVDHQYESDLLSHGDTVHIVSMDSFSADTIVPGTPMTPVAPTESEQTLVIDQYKGKAIAVQDMLKKQSLYELRRPYTQAISRAMAEAIDSYILGLWAGFDAAHKPAAVAALTFDTIVDANVILDRANVPQDGRALVVNADGLADLRRVPEFTLYNNTGNVGLVRNDANEANPGFVGVIYGAPVYWTNAVATDATTAKMMLIHKSAIAAAIQLKPEVEHDRDILLKADIISGSTLYGAKVVRPDHAVVISRTLPA